MAQAFLYFCECGTQLLCAKHFRMTAEAWTKAYESNDPKASIQLTPYFTYYPWHEHLRVPSGEYAVPEASQQLFFCPDCKRPLEGVYL